MKSDYTRFDFYLSYWFFAWAIIYILLKWFVQNRQISNSYIDFFIRNCNPLIILTIALVFSICSLIILIYKRAKPIVILLYVLINIVIKVIPIYFLMKSNIHPIPNIVSVAVITIIYELYLRVNGHNIIDFYKNELKNNMNGNTPFIHTILNSPNK